MSKQLRSRRLHLPNLSIKGFRCFDKLSIPELGRVNLFTGKNGSGKTTILEAVKVYASRADESVLAELIIGREEFFPGVNKDGDKVNFLDFKALFNGRKPSVGAQIEIGPEGRTGKLKIELIPHDDKSVSLFHDLVTNNFIRKRCSCIQGKFSG